VRQAGKPKRKVGKRGADSESDVNVTDLDSASEQAKEHDDDDQHDDGEKEEQASVDGDGSQHDESDEYESDPHKPTRQSKAARKSKPARSSKGSSKRSKRSRVPVAESGKGSSIKVNWEAAVDGIKDFEVQHMERVKFLSSLPATALHLSPFDFEVFANYRGLTNIIGRDSTATRWSNTATKAAGRVDFYAIWLLRPHAAEPSMRMRLPGHAGSSPGARCGRPTGWSSSGAHSTACSAARISGRTRTCTRRKFACSRR